MKESVFKEIHEALTARGLDWEKRQSLYYQMRYDGIRRATKPYPGAPDMHYALIDAMIEKIKPFYVQQIYAQQLLAAFTTDLPNADQICGQAELAFDKEIKQHSNFERTIQAIVDDMLVYGVGVTKVVWDAKAKEVRFDCIDPMYVVVPQWTEELQDADWLVHIIHLSEAQYRRNKLFKQDDNFIETIKGKGGDSYEQKQDYVELREGITCGQNDKQIVLWEVYCRENDKWQVHTVSPMVGCTTPVRDSFEMPYGHKELPFCDVRNELNETGWYSSRGLAAVLAPHEKTLTKLWNHKLQFLDFSANPVFNRAPGSVVNTPNLKNFPGMLLPEGVTQAPPTEAPIDFLQEMEMTRALGEDRVQIPDFGSSKHLSGKPGKNGDTTATEIDAIVGQSNQGNDLRSRVFRMQLSKIYRQAASLIAQYKLGITTQIDQFRIMPSGSADSWNTAGRAQQAMALFQALMQNPFVDQQELTKYMMEEVKPDLVERLFMSPEKMMMQQMQAAQAQGAPVGAPQGPVAPPMPQAAPMPPANV